MAKLTVAGIKQQIAALEAKAFRLAENETKASVARVRSLMDSLGVTVEHLTAAVSKKLRAANKAVASRKTVASKKAVTSQKSAYAKRTGAGVVRYRDPATGATWSGFGRAPGWLASAANREVFAVGKAIDSRAKKMVKAKTAAAPKKTSGAAKKSAGPAKKAAARKVKGAAAPASEKKVAPRKAASKKAAAAATAAEADASKVSASN